MTKLIRNLARFILIATATTTLPVSAKTIHVSQSSGDDNAAGTAPATAWKTLAKASIEYQPGDSILLKKGDTWNEELTPKGSGTPQKPILISSYGEGKSPSSTARISSRIASGSGSTTKAATRLSASNSPGA